MDVRDIVRGHYGRTDLEGAILAALVEAGVDVSALTVHDLAPVDHLHAGAFAATEYLLTRLDLGPASRLLDVGCGVGGPSRAAAAAYACSVTGIDLTPEFVATAAALSARVGLSHLVEFAATSGDALPFDDATFDRAMMIHVGMNIPDKPAVFAEVRRVMAPGGVFGVFDQMRVADADLPYPLPWASDERSSFVASPEQYAEHLIAAGFAVEHVEDRSAAVAGPLMIPAQRLGGHTVFGAAFAERIRNNVDAVSAGLLAPTLMLARAV